MRVLSALFEHIYVFWSLAFVISKRLNCSLSFGGLFGLVVSLLFQRDAGGVVGELG